MLYHSDFGCSRSVLAAHYLRPDIAVSKRPVVNVGDLLSYVDDVLIPRDRPSLSGDGFAVVGKLIKKALV